jgi:hypothetical protein
MAEPRKVVRCAIYTRKSTEDGLEQDYNSLDAQYDACTAYSLSQRHEGWAAEAQAVAELLRTTPEHSLAKTAAQQGKCRTRLGKLAALSCLAPDIVTAIVQGRQPATLTAKCLMQLTLPMDWVGQRAMLGFA